MLLLLPIVLSSLLLPRPPPSSRAHRSVPFQHGGYEPRLRVARSHSRQNTCGKCPACGSFAKKKHIGFGGKGGDKMRSRQPRLRAQERRHTPAFLHGLVRRRLLAPRGSHGFPSCSSSKGFSVALVVLPFVPLVLSSLFFLLDIVVGLALFLSREERAIGQSWGPLVHFDVFSSAHGDHAAAGLAGRRAVVVPLRGLEAPRPPSEVMRQTKRYRLYGTAAPMAGPGWAGEEPTLPSHSPPPPAQVQVGHMPPRAGGGGGGA